MNELPGLGALVSVTPLYAAPLALLLVALSLRVIGRRRALEVALGDGNDAQLKRRARVQANCAEYAPLGLILLLIAELQGAPHWLLHAMGAALLAGRLLHAYGVSQEPEPYIYRMTGMALTFAMLTTGAATLLLLALMG